MDKRTKKYLFFCVLIFILIGFYFFKPIQVQNEIKSSKNGVSLSPQQKKLEQETKVENQKPKNLTIQNTTLAVATQNEPQVKIQKTQSSQTSRIPVTHQENLLTYTIDDGQAVVQGDIVIGEIPRDTLLKSLTGVTKEPELKLWPSAEIAYYIQPDLPVPERVLQAFALFADTPIHFVPYTDQQDVLVFQNGTGACKSYLGRIGGKQPVWIPFGCNAQEIAHEIMHALGFIHEQNRSDRDQFVEINWANIDSMYKINFELFSPALTKLNALSTFDFESILIYADSTFSSNNRPTMSSKIEGQKILPRTSLSPRDVERLRASY